MTNPKENLIGKKFNRLTVINQAEDYIASKTGKHFTRWLCQCECGNLISVYPNDLKSGHTKSCGCLNRETTAQRNRNNKVGNRYFHHRNTMIGITTKNESFIIDTEDYDLCKNYTWWTNSAGYLETRKDGKRIFLHRLITNCPEGKFVDHINHDVSNNTKDNLRIVSNSQNVMNTMVRKDNQCGIKGVHRRKDCDRWEAHIYKDGKPYYLGIYKTKEEAIAARNNAELKLFKDYTYDPNLDIRNTYIVQD